MRYSKEHKLETHARIVKKASVRLREKGAHGVGVADLMKEAGLTHGGFYAHFDSREALVIEAFCRCDGSVDGALAQTGRNRRRRKKRLATIVGTYLTPLHRDDPGHGCAIPTLGAEIARREPEDPQGIRSQAGADDRHACRADSGNCRARPRAKQAMAVIATMMGNAGIGPCRRQWRLFRRDPRRRS